MFALLPNPVLRNEDIAHTHRAEISESGHQHLSTEPRECMPKSKHRSCRHRGSEVQGHPFQPGGGSRPACSMRSCLRVQQGQNLQMEGAALLCRITVGQREQLSDMQGSGFPSDSSAQSQMNQSIRSPSTPKAFPQRSDCSS